MPKKPEDVTLDRQAIAHAIGAFTSKMEELVPQTDAMRAKMMLTNPNVTDDEVALTQLSMSIISALATYKRHEKKPKKNARPASAS